MKYLSLKIAFLLIIALLANGCGTSSYPPPVDHKPIVDTVIDPRVETSLKVKKLGYTIQIGAFSNINNAAKLTQKLQKAGVDAYYFIHKSGLYKVRFGSFLTYRKALDEAERLQANDQIKKFYIVKPEEFVIAKQFTRGDDFVRKKLISTAERFLGIPYKWGGESQQTGFDCSGLTMVVYKLNGIALPRNSRSQYKSGRNIKKNDLQKGDLVFFATGWGKKVSHVGIYKGKGKFIHAPSKGKKIQVASLNAGYFKERYLGARTYL
jgi:cell wall-associated NlpC family hydrolase